MVQRRINLHLGKRLGRGILRSFGQNSPRLAITFLASLPRVRCEDRVRILAGHGIQEVLRGHIQAFA